MTIVEEKMHSFPLTKRSENRPTVFADASNQAQPPNHLPECRGRMGKSHRME